jgi:hypothetical protein
MKLEKYYKILAEYYFNKTIKSVIKIGNIDKKKNIILDFGSGYGRLKKNIQNAKVLNYDKIRDFTDTKNWKRLDFNIFVANQVFYEMKSKQIHAIFHFLKNFKKKTAIIIGISKQNFISKIAKNFLGYKYAHNKTILSLKDQLKIFDRYCIKLKEVENFYVNKVILYKLKK